jgi:hypothetical protein
MRKVINPEVTETMNKKMPNKKGIGDFALWTIRIGALGVIFVFFVIYVQSITNVKIDTVPMESELFMLKFLYAQNSICYYDSNNNFYPGVIDFSKFDDAVLDSSFSYPTSKFSAKLELYNDTGFLLKTAYYQKDYYLKYSKVAMIGQNYLEISKSVYVLIKNNDVATSGYLKITAVVEND